MRIRDFAVGAMAAVLLGTGPVLAEDCDPESAGSTWQLIQSAIFEKNGCTTAICHGSVAAGGGLDLSPAVAYDNLVDVMGGSVPTIRRVFPGEKDRSLLWLNLAAKTLPDEYTAPLRPMPADPLPALTEDELELVRLWIEGGAPEEGTVRGTEDFDPCLPEPEPIPVKPLPPPAPDEGFQIRMPPRPLPPNSESEVCYATYYDVSAQVPEKFRGPDGTTVRYKRNSIRQDSSSHHLIVNLYEGSSGVDDPEWGAWKCRGGAREGQACNPLDLGVCGEGGECATPVVSGVACIGYGPPDAGTGLMNAGLSGLQESAGTFEFAPGVFREMPLKGIILWNSHAFNLDAQPSKVEAWLNFEFAQPEEQEAEAMQIFGADEIFKMNAEPFQTDEPCNIEILPPKAQLFELSSHMHQRGKRWRTFLGAFRCEGGRNTGAPCSPLGYDFSSRNPCGNNGRCVSRVRSRAGDCNRSGDVTVDEVITGVNIALGTASVDTCFDADRDYSESVSVDEVVTSVTAALQGVPPAVERNPEESLLYTSFVYNDPVYVRYDPPMAFPGRGSEADERALTYCALYDNGHTDPATVKRKSTSPNPPVSFPGIGGPCDTPSHCTEGKVGAECNGRTERARDASCDSTTGAGDGRCDACTLTGGVTTEDEMLLLLGQYFVR